MNKIEYKLDLQRETKRCLVFSRGDRESGDLMTVYVHKEDVEAAGIDPRKGVVMTIEEAAV